MANTNDSNKINQEHERKIFIDNKIWKSVLIMSIPTILMMLIFGFYTFSDNVLSINFANDSYSYLEKEGVGHGLYKSKDFVRLFMAGVTPITTFMFSIVMLFGVGLGARFSINLGAKREERAIKTLKTTNQLGLLVSFLLMPVLFFASKPWMQSQFDGDPQMASLIADKGYDYIWIIILSFPLQMFNQVSTSVMRAEAKNKQALIAGVLPIFVNLLMDWVFMGPAGMGIEGGAWATFISYLLSTLLFVFYIVTLPNSRFKFHNLFGKKNFQFITIVGVVLLGIAPFLRNMAQSITQTLELRQMQDVSAKVYGNPMISASIMTAVFPIFGLFFPMMFGFIQAGNPIASYNYGHGNIKRVRETIFWTVIFSLIMGTLLFIISDFALFKPLNTILGNEDKHMTRTQLVSQNPDFNTLLPVGKTDFTIAIVDKGQKMYTIMMCTLPIFSIILGAMLMFGSTDRVLLNIIASSLRGVIVLTPMLFIFKEISIAHPGNVIDNLFGDNNIFSSEYLFWWFYPTIVAITAIILSIIMFVQNKKIESKKVTLEERLDKIHAWYHKKFKK